MPAAVPFLREAGALAQLGTVQVDRIVLDPIATDRPVAEWDRSGVGSDKAGAAGR